MRDFFGLAGILFVFVVTAAVAGEASPGPLPGAGGPPDATSANRRQVAADTEDSGGWIELGRALFEQGRPENLEEARRCLERAVEIEPGLGSAWYWLGRISGQAAGGGGVLDRIRLAGRTRTAFTRAVEIEPDSFQFTYALVQFHLQAPAMVGGDPGKAAALAVGFSEDQPDERALLETAVLLADRDYPGCLLLLDQVGPLTDLLVAETWETLIGQLGRALLDRGRWSEAIAVYQRACLRLPAVASGWMGLGRALAGADRSAEAADAYRQCLGVAQPGPVADAAAAALAGLGVDPFGSDAVPSDPQNVPAPKASSNR